MKTLTPMTIFKNQIAIIRKELKRLGFRNINRNKAKSSTHAYGAGYEYSGVVIEKRAITQDFIEIFTVNTPYKNEFSSIGFEFFFQNLDEKDFYVKVSCQHKERIVNASGLPKNLVQNKTKSGFESKNLSMEEFKSFLEDFTHVISDEKNTYKEVFTWLHSNYNDNSYVVLKSFIKKKEKVIAI